MDNIELKNYENFKRDVLKTSFIKYLQNATSEEEKKYLITIISNINWYWHATMFKYYSDIFNEIFDEKSILIDYSKDDSSSSKAICTYLQNGFMTSQDAIRVENYDKVSSDIEKVFLVDDFIGSGNTILKKINQLKENGCTNKQIYIISYICLTQGKNAIIQSENNNEIILKTKILENSYLEKGFNKKLIKYINSICKKCRDKEFAFGYEKCGSMLSINGTSPNDNLSLLYRDDIENWNKLLDRDINIIVLNEKRNRIIKERKNEISKYFYSTDLKLILTLKEFELLILLYNCFGMDIEILKNFNYFATISEYEAILKSLYDKEILKKAYFIEIIDKNMLQKLKKFDKYLENNFIKKKSKKFY